MLLHRIVGKVCLEHDDFSQVGDLLEERKKKCDGLTNRMRKKKTKRKRTTHTTHLKVEADDAGRAHEGDDSLCRRARQQLAIELELGCVVEVADVATLGLRVRLPCGLVSGMGEGMGVGEK